ncbi:uncharacterized protein CIMG_03892 [Coccidioides immitis RS]|uniref:Protein kinase domain-containing protein n=1 Tax=Coccidioides immitis (strain RS) TaxID=246410 RepID=J3KCC1_COCIM|nr:uncharacterized protein CIMG_03892 [Coccidioides immitis RS]EAS32868.3 hypothetical protein CIMG_03892 [Coccidioides immitis RS]TPX19851.1 hypothetical protein DIZ76_017644 [Coccidioides immitis]
MAQESDKYRLLFEEQKKLREETEQRLRATQQDLHTAQQSLHDEREQIRPTTIFEFLDGCHTHLFRGLTVRNPKDSTKGDLSNPDGKLRPERIRQWPDFAAEQGRIWKDLIGMDFVLERHFKSLHGLAESGAELRTEKTGSELDLRQFQHETLTRPVRSVVTKLHSNIQIRQHFRLLGSITFENHGNTLSEESTETRSLEGPPRPTKLRKTGRADATPVTTPRSSRPLADEFCIYNKGDGENVPAYIVELKAPHKLPLSTINSMLHDMDLEDVLLHTPDEPEEIACRREMAAVITQAFSYMIKSGVGYGYVCTGEAFIFLHVGKDPTTVFYYLSTPGKDVGETTGYTGRTDSPNKLHLTAVGQVLAFTLKAMQVEPYCQSWRTEAEAQLKPWRLIYQDDAIVSSPRTVTTQEYTPEHQNRVDYARSSPIVTRSKKPLLLRSSPCNPSQASSRSPVDSSDEDPTDVMDSPSKAPRSSANVMVVIPSRSSDRSSFQRYSENQGRSRPYCTHKCLLGLSKEGPLDEACPNIADHGTGQHQINLSKFSVLLHEQLLNKAKRISDPYESDGCESLHIHGSRGALFEVVLMPYGYKLVGKGFPPGLSSYLLHENAVYGRLRPIQGRHIPVCLGILDLSKRPLFYDGIARIPRLLLLSHAGIPLPCSDVGSKIIHNTATSSLQAIHQLGVYHGDAFVHNMFWSIENQSVMFIDFERAQIWNSRPSLQVTSLNGKRKKLNAKQVTKMQLKSEMLRMQINLDG